MAEERKMRAIVITAFGGPDRLTLVHMPVPTPGPNEVLIRVQAAGVGLWDVKAREGRVIIQGQHFPLILGWESAGIIEQVGENVMEFHPGDAVISYTYRAGIGHYAEYVSAPTDLVALAPSSVDASHAAALPVNGLTAYQTITEALSLRAGETLLITGAAGGTGTLAVQLAARLGAHVIATASAANRDYLFALGASQVIDYRQTNVVAEVRAVHPEGIDAVLDCVGGETAAQSLETLRDGGRLVSIVDLQQVKPSRNISTDLVYVREDGQQLAKLSRLVDAGELTLQLDHIFPLEEARRAHERIEERHNRGKIVLST